MVKNTALIGRMARQCTKIVSFSKFGAEKPPDEIRCMGRQSKILIGTRLSDLIFEKIIKIGSMFVLSIVLGMLCYILEEAVDVEEYRKNHNIFIIYCTYSFIVSIIVIIINKKLSFKDFLIKTPIKIFLTSFIIFFTYSALFSNNRI